MRPNPVKRALSGGEVSLGSMAFEFDASGTGRLAAAAGAEFLIYDMEHTGWSIERIAWLIASCGTEIVPMVRVPAAARHFISPALDMGAMGVMVPMVSGPEDARAVVDVAKYPPFGTRGVALGVAHDGYRAGDPVATMEEANAETLVICQIETAAGVEAVDEIAQVEGVDVLWVGQSDLTASMGIPGAFGDPRYREALGRVAEAAARHGKAAGFMAPTPEEARSMIDLGYRALAYWGDSWLYQQALRQGLEQIRAGGSGA